MPSILLCSFFACGAFTRLLPAQSNPPAPVVRETPTLRQRLALSHDQQLQFRAINQDRKAQIKAVEADTSLPATERKHKIKAIHAEAETKIRAMLNENQLAEYDQIQRERREAALRKRQTTLAPTTAPETQGTPPPQ